MTENAIEEARLLAPVVGATSEFERARQKRKLAGAIAAESPSPGRMGRFARERDVTSNRAVHGPRRRTYLAGAASLVVAAAAVAIPLALRANGPSTTGVPKSAAAVMELDSMRLRLPSSYRLTAATASNCPLLGVGFAMPASSGSANARTFVASPAETPPYASQIAAAANAEGGCIAMILAPPYTPTSTNPDPEAGSFENSPPVQVGPYQGRVGAWTTVAKPSNVATQQAALYVEIPVAGGQFRDLAVSANNLSESALVSLVANGLSVRGSSSNS